MIDKKEAERRLGEISRHLRVAIVELSVEYDRLGDEKADRADLTRLQTIVNRLKSRVDKLSDYAESLNPGDESQGK